MADRHFPVRPNLDQLKHQAKDLLHAIRQGDLVAIAEFQKHHHAVGLRRDDGFARLLLDHRADPNARAALRKRLRFVKDETTHEYRDDTPLARGQRFHDQDWVSKRAMRLIVERGGRL